MQTVSCNILLLVFLKLVQGNFSVDQNLLRDQDVIFGVPQNFDNGIHGSGIGINDEYVVEVHQTQNETLWYRVGQIFGLRINWTESYQIIDPGTNPNVALNKLNQVVMIFESNSSLFFKTGFISENHEVTWNPSIHFDDQGQNPSVTITTNGTVIVLYELDSYLVYRIGILDGINIHFLPYVKFTNGTNATIVVNDKLEVVEVHYHSYTIFYAVGLLDSNIIAWSEVKELQRGIDTTGTVSLNCYSQVFLVFKRNDHEIVSSVGLLDGETKSIEFLHERKLPLVKCSDCSIVANKNFAVLTFASGITTSLIRNRKRWMELTPGILDRALWQTTLPGSHDAGAYSLSEFRVKEGCKKAPDFIPGILTKLYAETQNENMQEQLNNGVRYFDIRPYYWPQNEGGTNDFHVYHDNLGPRISRILYLTKLFMESVQKELVILRFSHFCQVNFDELTGIVLHERLSRLIRSVLGQYILNMDSQDGSFFTNKLKDILKSGPKVLVIYDHDFALDQTAFGFLRNRPYFDNYSNTDNLSVMQSDQLDKLKLNYGTKDRLFLLSYTLTWQLATFSNPNANNLNDLSKNASKSLADFVDDNYDKYQINVLFVDFCSEARVTDVAIVANEKRSKVLLNEN